MTLRHRWLKSLSSNKANPYPSRNPLLITMDDPVASGNEVDSLTSEIKDLREMMTPGNEIKLRKHELSVGHRRLKRGLRAPNYRAYLFEDCFNYNEERDLWTSRTRSRATLSVVVNERSQNDRELG
ncbi:hypothetical protein WN48_04856 [Eufriesea mexicana]|uniref:Uncharacterized protein n=1 Tax=Eufriesea mexicana TaxID=516756 RepID=A0A310SIX8_9HYME|nr:hypothetical protein WN48_04856 [Eufriesea mexicana]